MKKTFYSQYRLEVLPEDPDDWQKREIPETSDISEHQANLRVLSDLRSSVRKHCDGVLQIIETFDKKEICSYCGYEWDEDPADKLPLCCERAQMDWEKETERMVTNE